MKQTVKRQLSDMTFCFDLDGTLIDTAPDLVRVLNEVVEGQGLRPANYTRARNTVGFGSRALIQGAYKENEVELPIALLDKLQKEFLDRYEATSDQLSKPFTGVVETLLRLKHAGSELNICTNKPGYLARPLMDKLGLSPLFKRIIGSDDVAAKKPNPQHIFTSAGHSDSSRIVMVGDALPDYKAGRNAGVLTVMVTYGYSPIPIRGLGGDIILSHFREIPEAVAKNIRA